MSGFQYVDCVGLTLSPIKQVQREIDRDMPEPGFREEQDSEKGIETSMANMLKVLTARPLRELYALSQVLI